MVEGNTAAERHRERLEPYVLPHLARRERGERHPVHDFMFTYYSFRPAQLLQWHPAPRPRGESRHPWGDLVHVLDAPVTDVDTSAPHPVHSAPQPPKLARQVLTLLEATAERPAQFGCFGLHEWAMVHRLPQSETRHDAWPLRLGTHGTDAVVETHQVACTHFDAFRFFTPEAVPLNRFHPGRDDRPDFEQGGCLHANMDLYKHAFRLVDIVGSDLVAECFLLAWEIRILDMRAAPYDLNGVTFDPTGEPWTPLLVETDDGKAEYVEAQRGFSARAAVLRAELIASLRG